jgi:hypothetical protein
MEALHDFLKAVDALKYQSYQDAISHFLQSPQMQLFDANSYVDTIVRKISMNLKMPGA